VEASCRATCGSSGAAVSALENLGGDGSAGRTTAPQTEQGGDRGTADSTQARCVCGLLSATLYEQVTEKHQVKVSDNWLRLMLQDAGVVERKSPRPASIGAGANDGDGGHAGCPVSGCLDPQQIR
jgi:hypothetical protein